MKIGLFFGSFNPIHNGHLLIAQALLNQTDCKRVWLVLSPQNPFKDKKSLLNEQLRLQLCELATQDVIEIQPSNVEFFLPKPSYTIDTLTHLAAKYKSYEFCILMGADNLEHFHKWKKYETILEYYPIYVYPRPQAQIPSWTHPNINMIDAPFMDISATLIRNMLKNKHSIRYLTPEPVREYIERNRLYLD